MRVVQFEPEHLRRIRPQPQQAEGLAPLLDDAEYAANLVKAGPCISGIHGDEIMLCFGILKIEPHRGLAWAILSRNAGLCAVAIHRAVRRFLDGCGVRRIEAAVDIEFLPGHRAMKALGFQWEGVMRCYTADGRDQHLYARVS